MTRIVSASVARRADFDHSAPDVVAVSRDEWRTGDFVVAEVLASENVPYLVETTSGRMAEVAPGDRIVGALGRREATLEVVGDWQKIESDVRELDLGPIDIVDASAL